jgi:hypothetical protein
MSIVDQDRYTASRRSLDELYLETQRSAQSTLAIGRTTLTELHIQEEKLQTAEDTIESSDYTMERSLKTLRGMTWSGMFYNAFSFSSPEPVARRVPGESASSAKVATSSDRTSSRAITENNSADLIQSSSKSLSHDDEQLLQISKAVDEIYRISVATGETLESHKSTVDRINTKTEIVSDKVLEATLKSARITSRRASSKFLGRYQFIDLESSHFLCIRDDDCLHLTNRGDRSTMFDLFIKEDNVIGIQSVKTILFLGSTALGLLRVSGEYFGRYEECYVAVDGKPSGILLLSKNWGAGGWLKRPRSKDNEELINEATSSIHDRENMILFHVQRIQVENSS